jgi:hypothetical protein
LNRPALFQKPAALASFENHVTVGALDGGACKERYRGRTFIAQSFEANAPGWKSAWPQIAICPKLEAPALPL